MAREDDWLMGSLAAQDAYQGGANFPPPPPTGIRTGVMPRTFEDYLGEATKPRSVLRTGALPRTYDEYLAKSLERPAPPLPEDDTWLNQAKAGALGGLALLHGGPSTLMEQTVGDPEAEVREKRRGMLERGAEAVPKPKDLLGYILRQGAEAAVNPWNYSAGIPLGAAWAGASGLGAGLAGYAAKDTPYETAAQLAGGFLPPQAVTGAARGVGRFAGAGLDLLPGGVGMGIGGRMVQPQPRMGDLAQMPAPQWFHGISVNKLSKPLSEMQAAYAAPKPTGEKIISPEALEGSVLLPAPGDRSLAGSRLLGVGGKPLDIPTDLQGGAGFMSRNPQVWASDQGVISTMAGRVKRLSDKFNTDVVVPYTAMGERSVDFSHHMSDTLAEMVKNAKILGASKDRGKVTAATFDEAMRMPIGEFRAAEDFPGIKSKNLREYLIESPGVVRNKFAKLLDTAPYQRAGFPNVAEARFAVTDPRLLYEPSGAAGLSISRVDPNAIGPSAHRTYGTGIGGEYLGGFERSIPKEIMFPDMFKAYAAKTPQPSRQDYMFRMGTAPNYQLANQQWLEGVMRYLESRRNAPQ